MTRLLGVAAGGSLLAGPALVTSQFALRHANALLQQAKADLAAPDTPLGRAQADAVRACDRGAAGRISLSRLASAKQFKGSIYMTVQTYNLSSLKRIIR